MFLYPRPFKVGHVKTKFNRDRKLKKREEKLVKFVTVNRFSMFTRLTGLLIIKQVLFSLVIEFFVIRKSRSHDKIF